MQKMFTDYVGKLPRSKEGHRAILVCVDAFSKFVWMVPMKEMTTNSTIKALKERIFCCFSVPEVLVTDNARCFTSGDFRQLCFGLVIKHVTTSPYYPQPSHTERFNRNLHAALIAYHSEAHTSWDSQLVWLQIAFNMAQHEAIKSSSFAVMFPFRANHPLCNHWKISQLLPERCNRRVLKQRWGKVKDNLRKSHKQLAKRYNNKRAPAPFKIGELVYYWNHPVSDC
jgi:transposase InsO family protein